MKVGVLGWHGSFKEHEACLRQLEITPIRVCLPSHLETLTHLIIPGGESTAIGQFITKYGLFEPLRERINKTLAVWGTCAGAILLSKIIIDSRPGQAHLEVMDITIRRNAFGRQIESFETDAKIDEVGDVPAVFIRAPVIEETRVDVEVTGRLPDGTIIAAKQKKCMVTTFHPELTNDLRMHRYFVENF